MAAPTLFDGILRAFKLLAFPSAAIVGLVGGSKILYGGQTAGTVYLVAVVMLLASVYLATKYWNTFYTIGFVGCGAVVLFGLPSVISNLIPTEFATLGKLAILVFVLLVAMRIPDKLG